MAILHFYVQHCRIIIGLLEYLVILLNALKSILNIPIDILENENTGYTVAVIFS